MKKTKTEDKLKTALAGLFENKKALYILGLILAFVILLFPLLNSQKVQQNQQAQNLTTVKKAQVTPQEFIVTLTDNGFLPKSIAISAGDSVRFTNKSSNSKASVNSDDYPTNKKYPELNLGTFQKDASLIHIFKTPGIYTYHDQFHSQFKGTVIVQ